MKASAKANTDTHLPAGIGPRAKLHLAFLVVEREPRDIDGASAVRGARKKLIAAALEPIGPDVPLKNAWRNVQATAVAAHDHVSLICAVEPLVSTINM